MKINTALFMGALLVGGSALQATTLNYAFGGNSAVNSPAHTSYTFTPTVGSSPTITAYGFTRSFFNGTLSAADLYSKGSSGFPPPSSESGLGLNNPDQDYEITPGSFIMLDLGNLSISTLGVYMESTTGDDSWEIWGSNTAAVAGQSFTIPGSHAMGVITGNTQGDQNVNTLSGDRYIFITADSGNVLLGAITATTPVPEPASASLLGLALVGSGLLFRRRFSKKA